MSENRILIIDDEIDVCNFFSRLLGRRGYFVTTATNEGDALEALSRERFQVAMVDLKLPDTDGLKLLKLIKTEQPSCEVIIMTGYSTIKTAVQAIQSGAFEYIEKPFDEIGEIERLIEKAASHGLHLSSGKCNDDEWKPIADHVGFFVGKSQEMRRLVGLAYKIASKDINVLIQGNTGSGKEVLARFVHAASHRADQPFIAVNCGALSENLLESELFGHERGAFTGANQSRRGIFELAHRGTLFLDEVGDASPSIQVKLLRVLETGEFNRVGGEKPIKTDVRLISATNVNLEEAIAEKTFREDLYYRLNVVRLEIPSLDERSDDISPLSEYLVHQYNPNLELNPSTVQALQNHSWPGNIRELANTLRRAVALCDGGEILPHHLGARLLAPSSPPKKEMETPLETPVEAPPATDQSPDSFWNFYGREETLKGMTPGELNRMLLSLRGLEKSVLSVMRSKGLKPAQGHFLKETEAETIRKALEENRWNITATAKVLGIARNTLHRKIKLYGLLNP